MNLFTEKFIHKKLSKEKVSSCEISTITKGSRHKKCLRLAVQNTDSKVDITLSSG